MSDRPSPFVEYRGDLYNVFATQVQEAMPFVPNCTGNITDMEEIVSLLTRRMNEIAEFDRRATATLVAKMLGLGR